MAPHRATFSFALNRKKLRQVRRREGRYLLRTNLCGREPAQLWQFYIQLVEVEAAFKTMKDDLQLRPIYHQLEERIEAHIFVAFLAYCLHVTLRARLKPLAGGLTPRAVLDKLAAVQMLDVNFPTTDGRTLVMRRYTELGPEQSSWSSNSNSICRRNHHHASPRQQRRFPSHPTPCSGDFRDASVDIAHFFTPVEKVGLACNAFPLMALNDRPPFSGRPSLTGHCGHGWTCSRFRLVVNDPGRVKTLRGITAPGILRLVVTLRAKKCKNSSSAQRYNQIRFRFHTA